MRKQGGRISAFLLAVAVLVSGWGLAVTRAAGGDSKSAFLQAVEKAARDKERAAFEKLFYWEGASPDMKEKVGKYFIDGVLAGDVESVSFQALKPDAKTEYTLNGVRTYPNLKPLGRVRIQFKKNSSGIASTSAFYGVKDGAYYFTVAVQEKVREDAPVTQQIQVNVFGTMAPKPVKFKGHFIITQNEKPIRYELEDEGRGNQTMVVRGEDLTYLELRRTSSQGELKVRIQVGDDEVFQTEYLNHNNPIVYRK